jgi:diadenosine tetraphosphate (Ap4A) HIT family hydrolase
MAFSLHSRLASDCVDLGRLALCRVLLVDERRWPWLLLVPERGGISEIHQLAETDLLALARESAWLSRRLAEAFEADRMNVAALGNIVPQLHVHHVVRHHRDGAWPHPVWGRGEREPYPEAARAAMVTRMGALLAGGPPRAQ